MEKWKLFAIISMLFAGLTSVIAKFGMKNLSSDVALSVRTIVVFGIVTVNAFLLNNALSEIRQAPKSNLIFLVISGITTSLSWIFYYRAMKEGQVSYVASIDKASIVVTILLSFLLLKEPVTAKILLGAGFIIVGMFILIWK
ncbi:EamA family transporter [Thermoflexibacter ruber]|uniref:Transporter family protein n=1 Tax=Thermoflexibacter ruber TaxID=1003 RepID=A0A1I2JIG8_9BACT|nr:EamA family transporter [Thermoflexibacter ruber]SFF52957.1 transporter family protein [Thermoflexibacter ruber]